MKIELENVLPAEIEAYSLKSSQKNWRPVFDPASGAGLLSGPSIPVRIGRC